MKNKNLNTLNILFSNLITKIKLFFYHLCFCIDSIFKIWILHSIFKVLECDEMALTLSSDCFCILYLIIPSAIFPQSSLILLKTSPFLLYLHI